MVEEYRKIKDFPEYLVSNLGNIKSTKRGGKILSYSITRLGYKVVIIYANKKMNTLYVAREVLSAFRGFPAWLCIARNIDGDRSNCRLDNLEWLICETTEEYDPSKSHRRGVLKPDETKGRMTEAKYNQSEETRMKQVESRRRCMELKRELKNDLKKELKKDLKKDLKPLTETEINTIAERVCDILSARRDMRDE